MLESIFVVALFLLYMLLWKVKKIQQKRVTGIDPEVMGESTSNVQQFMSHFTNFLTVYAAIVILIHATNFQWEITVQPLSIIVFRKSRCDGFLCWLIWFVNLSVCADQNGIIVEGGNRRKSKDATHHDRIV